MWNRSRYYRLIDHPLLGKITEPCDVLNWAQAFENPDRRVALDVVDDITISTVFLGLDHNYSMQGPPLLFETMTFIGEFEQGISCQRYSTWGAAVAGHRAILDEIRHSSTAAGDHGVALLAHLRDAKVPPTD